MKADAYFHTDSVDVDSIEFTWQKNTYKFQVLRLDRVHASASGNKFFKLKYNAIAALQCPTKTLVTFGGAWSNHIQATAAVCSELGLRSIGLIRGEEPEELSETLLRAKENGMELRFISRAEYREKHEDFFKAWLRDEYGQFHLVPEGGSNYLGMQGCMEICKHFSTDHSSVFLAAGTGATAAGILMGSDMPVHVVSALKGGEFLKKDIATQIYWATVNDEMTEERMQQMRLHTDFHFGGYAKFNSELIELIREFYKQTEIKLEPIYTGKVLACLLDALKSGSVRNDGSALMIHTGGLQGLVGVEKRLGEDLFLG